MTRRPSVRARSGSVVASGALAAGLLAVLPVTGQAATSTVPVTHSCVGSFYNAFNKTIDTVPGTGNPPKNQVVVDQPSAVAPGEVYQVTIQPGRMRTGGVPAGRLSYDLTVPDNATLLRAEAADNGEGVSGTAQVTRIDASDGPSDTGDFVRVWGGGAAVTPNQWTTGLNAWRDGLTVEENSTFRLPAVTLTLRAAVGSGGQRIASGFRAAGATGTTSGRTNALLGMERSGVLGGEANDIFYCGASANARALANTPVDRSRPVYQARTETVMTTPDSTVVTGQSSLELSATVSSDEESITRVRTGSMRFTVTDAVTGAVVATVRAGAIDGTGKATATYTFPALTAGELTHRYLVRAEYGGIAGDVEASTSATASTVTVGYREHTADLRLTSVNGQLSGGSLPVTVSGQLSFTDNAAIPNGTRVELLRDGTVIGSRLTVAANGTFSFPTDMAPQRQTTTAYRYSVRVVPRIIGSDRYSGESTAPVAAVVTGTQAGTQIPPGGFGVPGSSDLLRDPQAFWRWTGDSIGSLGTFSVELGNANR